MNSGEILSYVTFFYFFCFFFYLIMIFTFKDIFGLMGTYLTLFTLLLHSYGIVLRWIESYKMGIGHAPLTNLYESLIFFAWAIIFLYLIVEFKTKNRSPGVFTTPVAFLIMAYASYGGMESRITPLIPALKSNWLIAHVVTCFVGYGAFALAFSLSIMYLLKQRKENPNSSILNIIPPVHILDELTYQIIAIGFVMLTLGIITGAVWAHYAWGRYWGWDPKETWSLITWLIYGAFLHGRYVRGWRGRLLAVLSIVGFLSVIFTYLGVNLLLSGLHSYATG